MFVPRYILPAVIIPLSISWGALQARPTGDKDKGTEFFERRIRPILVESCYECHSEAEEEQKGGLLLDRISGWLEGGDTGKAVVPGNLSDSLLIAAVRRLDEDSAMPPKHPLSEEKVKLLERWVLEGAPGPATDMGETKFSKLGDQEHIFKKAKNHWAFQAVDPTSPPQDVHPEWRNNPVDAFVFSKIKKQGHRPSPPADNRILTRRLSYDLTGLPPKAEMFEQPINDLINSLIESPQFGEHFARMWLDVARYADTANTNSAGNKTPHYYPYAFTYRDYVIESFNHDKPFNRFIEEQLAADLMGLPSDAPELAALGFIGLSPIRNKTGDFVDDVIDTTSRGFLGLTVACSRCHDHKFEPIPTADYYSLYGVFNSVVRPDPWKIDSFPLIQGYAPESKAHADYLKLRKEVDLKIVEAGKKKKKGNNRSLADSLKQTTLAQLLITHDGAPARAMAISDTKRPIPAFVFIRGDSSSRGEEVPRRFIRILDPSQQSFSDKSSGRLDLAKQISDPKNPLTARVFVNRVWGMLIGTYLVATPSDFGLQGSPPSHPELLDWLAADFVAHGWSLKHLVRTIVSTHTYQQSSVIRLDLAEIDPENQLIWRANLKRLQIEELRDSLLAVSGTLDPRMRGRSGDLWGDQFSPRRSIYGFINRLNLDPTLRNFDFPSPMQSQEKRTESIVAPQALFTMNSPFAITQAENLIAKLKFEKSTERQERVNRIYNAILNRSAEKAELERISRFLDLEEGRDVDPWPLLAQSLFMSNEFLYVD